MGPAENDFWDASLPRENYTAFYSKIDQYFAEGKLTDVNVVCGDAREFKCHRLVLAAASEYFEKMFGGSWKESRAENIVLPDVDGATFEGVVQFAYKGKFLIDDDNVCHLLRVSDKFGMSILENRCVRYLAERKIPTNHALDLFLFACTTFKSALIPPVSRFILENLEHLLADEDGLLSITLDDMRTLLTHWRPSSSRTEHLLLKVLLHWVTHSDSSRLDKKSLWAEVTRSLRFQYISEDFLQRYFHANGRVDSCDVQNLDLTVGSSASRLMSLHMYAGNSDSCDLITMKTFEDGIEWYPPVRVRDALRKMRTVAVDSRLYSYSLSPEGSLEFSVYSSASLSDKQSLATPTDLQGFHYRECSLADFETISVCSDSISPRIYLRHDLSSRFVTNLFAYHFEINKWFPLTKNYDELKVDTITYSEGRLYAISFEKSLQAYDPRAGKWENLANTELSHSYSDKCCCHKGKIYVSCEMVRKVRKDRIGRSQVMLEVYDPVANRWSKIAPAPTGQPITFLGWLVSFENKLWMFGESEYDIKRFWNISTENNYYVQRYDSYLQEWDKAYRLFDETTNNVIDVTLFESERRCI